MQPDHPQPDQVLLDRLRKRIFGEDLSIESRTERRFPCAVTPARIKGGLQSEAFVTNVSKSGLGLVLTHPLPSGEPALVEFGNMTVTGEIRFCRPNPDGTFDAGLSITDLRITPTA